MNRHLREIHRRSQAGAAAVEFALVAVVLLMIIAAVIEFGKTYNEIQVMTGAAREGARFAAVRKTVTEIKDRVSEAAAPYTTSESPAVVVGGTTWATGEPCEENPGEPVEVAWTQDFVIEIVGIPTINSDVDISGTFRCE